MSVRLFIKTGDSHERLSLLRALVQIGSNRCHLLCLYVPTFKCKHEYNINTYTYVQCTHWFRLVKIRHKFIHGTDLFQTKWLEERQVRTAARASRRPSPGLRGLVSSFLWAGSTVTSRAAPPATAGSGQQPPSTARQFSSISRPRFAINAVNWLSHYKL